MAALLSYAGMCGRYALFGPISRKRPLKELVEGGWISDLIDAINKRPPKYNFAPTQISPVVVGGPHGVGIRDLRWGLVPSWAKDIKFGGKCINARAETLEAKPAFRSAFKTRRCLVPANGYFEWKGHAPDKQPYFIHDPEHELMLFAGLWETWRPSMEEPALHTYAIITGPPGIVSGDIHDRAPVVVPDELCMPWMTATRDEAKEILAMCYEPWLTYHPVSRAVGSPKNDTPDLVEPLEIAA